MRSRGVAVSGRGLLLAVGLLALAAEARAAVAPLNGWTNISSTAPGNISGSVTTGSLTVAAGTQRLFVVSAVLEVGSSSTTMTAFSATFGGVAMHPIAATAALSGREHAGMWYLLDAEVPAGAQTIRVSYTLAANTVTGLHVKWASYSGVDQTTPIVGSNANLNAATNVTFGATVSYLLDGLSVYATGNGGTPATIPTPPAGFTTLATTTTSAHSSFIGQTVAHTSGGSYASTTAVTFGGSTSGRSAIVVTSLRPGSANGTVAGTVTATPAAASCTAISVGAPYSGDADGDNTLSYRYRTPSGTGAWGSTSAVPHAASPYSFDVTGLSFGSAYDVELTYVDPDGVTGTNPQTISNVAVGADCTGAGAVTAAQTTGATPSIAVSAPYTNDANADNTLSYRHRTPSGTGAWTIPVSLPHAASPYAFTVSGLSCGATYDIEVSYLDANGIGAGTSVQTLSGVSLSNCTGAGSAAASVDACNQVTLTGPFTNDANANGATSYERGPAAGGPWTAVCSGVTGASPRACVDSGVSASGTYYYQVTFSDPDGVSGSAQQAIGPYSTPACNEPVLTTQVPAASATSCSQIAVSLPFSGDTDDDSAASVEYSATGTWPGTTACSGLSGASPRSCAVSGLANATAYYFRVTFADPDGVNGANPQVVGPQATQDCRVAPLVPSATASACNSVNVSAAFSGDWDADSTTAVSRGTAAGGPFAAVAGCSALSGGSPRTCNDTSVAESTTYYYQAAFADPDGVNGTAVQVTGGVTTPACLVTNTTAGTATALVAGCRQIDVSAPFSGDEDEDGSVLVEYNTSNTWTGSQSTACAAVPGASPRVCLASGLNPSTAYYLRVTYADTDGVSGANPQVLPGTYTTSACSGDGAPPMILVLSPARNAIVGGSELFRIQVYDADGLAGANPVLWGVDTLSPVTAATQNTNYVCAPASPNCAIYEFAVDTTVLTAGAHSATVRATDAAVAPTSAQRSWAFRVNNVGSRPAGAGTLLRRSHGSQLCLDCHNLSSHTSQATSVRYGAWAQDCLACHAPHKTRNIYLVRESIETPNSGYKTVDLRNLNGVEQYGLATPTADGNGVNVCEACHTRTKNPDASPRARNDAPTDWTKHYTTSCVNCHPHAKGFAAGESEGNATCSGCHADIWNGMTGAVAKASRHSLGNVLGLNDAFTDSGLGWTSPLSANAAAARSCVNMCHDDHPHDLTSPLTPTHENSVYRDATSSASRAAGSRTSASKDKTDFQAADANGGMCISCHRNPVSSGRPSIGRAPYDASAHDFVSNAFGTWTYTLHDGGVFDRNCTKCHSNGDAAPGASAIPFGAVHFSDFPKLLSGAVNPNGAAASLQCYACHGNGTTGTDRSGKVIATQIAKARSHPANSDAVHDSVSEQSTAAFGNTLGVTGRHSNCLDCHDSHRAKAGTHTTPGNLAGPPLEGAMGAQLSTNPAFWTNTAATNFTKKTLVGGTDVEASLCFKCHSRYYWGTTAESGRGVPPPAPSGATYTTGTAAFTNGGTTVTGTGTTWSATAHVGWVIRNNANGTWHLVTAVASATSLTIAPAAGFSAAASAYTLQMAETDVAKEFNPGNVGSFAGSWAANETAGGFHPVLAAAGSNLGAVNLANLVTTNQPWSTTARNLMTCTDCHESETAADPNGPHGSTAGFILRGPNTGWAATTTMGSAGMPAGTFCANCHSATFASSRFAAHFSRSDHRVACWNCHAAVPHGGPRPGMLIAPGGAAAGVGGSIAGWDTSAPYWGIGTSSNKLYIVSYPTTNTTGWGQGNCGCNGTGH